jgi:CRISPR-associated protein Csx10
MSRYYLSYRLNLDEPLVLSDGSQLGNVLQTQDYIPGSSILGLCAGLYLGGARSATASSGTYTNEFRSLFLSDDTLYSPAYPLIDVGGRKKGWPMPMSVFGCKYYGVNEPGKSFNQRHGFQDYLYHLPDEACSSCKSPLEHKSGYICYADGDYYNFSPGKEIISHNQVGEDEEEKSLFSFEALPRNQQFYGEIAFRKPDHRNLLQAILKENPRGRLGKARNRGYGQVSIFDPNEKGQSFRSEWSKNLDTNAFSIYFFSNTILVDRGLRYLSGLDVETLAYWLGLKDLECIEEDPAGSSFYRSAPVLGFNQHRKMPLPFELAISRGSVFAFSYKGKGDIASKLEILQREGIGLRRNEGFGQVVINHKIHTKASNSSREASL